MAVVTFETKNTDNGFVIGIATLNVEKALNALNLEMIELLYNQLLDWQSDEHVSMVLLQGAGDKAFCAGGDVVSLFNAMHTGEPSNYIETFFTKEYRLDYLIHNYAKPLCVWGNGIIMGGGLGLMAGASHRVLTESSRIAMPEITIGLYPDVGGSYFLNKMPAQVGLFLGLTGASLNAQDALYIGLGDTVIEHQFKSELIDSLISTKWSTNAAENHQVLSHLLTTFNAKSDINQPSNVESHNAVFAAMAEVDALADKVEAILSFETDDKWLTRAQKALSHGSPLSAHLVYQQLKRANGLSLKDCFQMELGMSVRCGQLGEFKEGVRALLIDKDNAPHWQFDAISNVDSDVIESFFNVEWPNGHPLTDL